MTQQTIAKSWLWPDRAIGKREAHRLRDEHNAVVTSHDDLLAALERLERCDRLGCNCKSVKAVCGPDSVCDSCFALAAIAKAKPKDPCSVCGGSHGLCATPDCDNPVGCDPEERGESWVYCDSCDAEMKGGA